MQVPALNDSLKNLRSVDLDLALGTDPIYNPSEPKVHRYHMNCMRSNLNFIYRTTIRFRGDKTYVAIVRCKEIKRVINGTPIVTSS